MTDTCVDINPTECIRCNTPLTPVFKDLDNGQWANALGVRIIGYYGGYFDRLEEEWGVKPLPTVYLCKSCADSFVMMNPWIKLLIEYPE